MPIDLPSPIADYFAATNAHDAEAVAARFTEDGWVHDERQDHRGREAIREWAAETFRQYAMVQTPRRVRDESDSTIVRAEVAGTFPGSPIELDFRFRLDGDAIGELQIG